MNDFSLNKDGAGNIEVCDFMTFINRVKCKSAPIQPLNFDVSVSVVHNTFSFDY